MTNNTKINKSNQEETKMRKLIVEAPELRDGQTDSSGGIRENGKMAVQYKNPVPYVEPKLPPVVQQKPYTRKDMLKDWRKDFVAEVGHDIISMLWYEYGRPFLKIKLHNLGRKVIAYLESPKKSDHHLSEKNAKELKTIEAEYVKIQEADNLEDNDKIIHFPKNVSANSYTII